MGAFAKSAWLFLLGMVKRLWAILPAFLLDPFDFVNKFILPRWFPESEAVDMPAYLFPYAFVVGLVVAAFLTYHDLRKGISRDEKIVARLKEFFKNGEHFERLEFKSDIEFVAYKAAVTHWFKGAESWITENMGETAASVFRDTSGILPITHSHDFNREHMGYINTIQKWRKNLKGLIESPVWDSE